MLMTCHWYAVVNWKQWYIGCSFSQAINFNIWLRYKHSFSNWEQYIMIKNRHLHWVLGNEVHMGVLKLVTESHEGALSTFNPFPHATFPCSGPNPIFQLKIIGTSDISSSRHSSRHSWRISRIWWNNFYTNSLSWHCTVWHESLINNTPFRKI